MTSTAEARHARHATHDHASIADDLALADRLLFAAARATTRSAQQLHIASARTVIVRALRRVLEAAR